MARYVTRPRATVTPPHDEDWLDRGPMLQAPTVDDRKEVDTGIVDQHGHSIMRLQGPIGFGRDEEW